MPVKSKVEISQNVVAFSEYMNFMVMKFLFEIEIIFSLLNITDYVHIIFILVYVNHKVQRNGKDID